MMDSFLSNVAGREVVVRVDHNVPSVARRILDVTRLSRSLPALADMCAVARRVLILSHRGDPAGHDDALSLRPVYERIADRLPGAVFCPDPTPDALLRDFLKHQNATVFYAENVRFLPHEKRNDPVLAQGWAQCGELFVLDAFSVAHRDHASIAGIASFLPGFAGPTLEAELAQIDTTAAAAHRMGVVIGGAKLATKLALARRLAGRMDRMCLVGMTGYVAATRERCIFENAAILPCDLVLRETSSGCLRVVPAAEEPGEGWVSHDTGPTTLSRCLRNLERCDTIVWNGPLGVYEREDGRSATGAFCSWLAGKRETQDLKLIAGGGDTLAALNLLGWSHLPSVSVPAGGSLLAYLADKRNLPGLRSLDQSWTSVAS